MSGVMGRKEVLAVMDVAISDALYPQRQRMIDARAAIEALYAERDRLAAQHMESTTRRGEVLIENDGLRARAERAESELAALRAERDGLHGVWLPMESAPRDGSHIDLWVMHASGDEYRLPDCYFWHGRFVVDVSPGEHEEVSTPWTQAVAWMRRPLGPSGQSDAVANRALSTPAPAAGGGEA